MPTYQFKCPRHPEQEAEAFWAIIDGADTEILPTCPECGVLMRRKFTAPAVHFKGGGWGGSSS